MPLPVPVDWVTVFDTPHLLGESPFWSAFDQQLYGVDIAGRSLWCGDPQTGALRHWPMPSEPGCAAPIRGNTAGGVVVALRDGVYAANAWGGELTRVGAAEFDTRNTRFNDGKASPQGEFFVGTYFEPRNAPGAALYVLPSSVGQASQALAMPAVLTDAYASNGLAWSPDGQITYWADTARHAVYRFGSELYPAAGSAAAASVQALAPWVLFDKKPEGWAFGDSPQTNGKPRYGGRPDGAAVDQDGNYWVAMYEGGCIVQLSPAGLVLQILATPMLRPTMPCFGGADLRTLFVTSASYNRPEAEAASQPQAGCVVATRVTVAGLPTNAVVL